MPLKYPTPRSVATSVAAAALTVSALAVTAAPAQAVAAPGSVKATIRNASTAILSWRPTKTAEGYEVQVDTSSSFASPDYSAKTLNNKTVPAKALLPGKNFFRVRAYNDNGQSTWISGSFTMAPVTTPIPLAPADGSSLQQPQSPPLLQWSSSQGAISYTVAVDGDADMIGAKVYSTKTTSLVVPDPLTTGDWYWQVTAVKGTGLVSLPSAVTRFDISPIAAPSISYPANDVDQAIEDVVLDWTPVPGARTYDVQVALDASFNNIALSVTGIQGTRYSPPTTLNSDQFWWRVRGVDLASQPTPWAASLFGFQRQWPQKPTAIYPKGPDDVNAAPTAYATSKQYYQWSPVKHATIYYLQTSSDKNFSVGVDTCKTALTTYTPRDPADCGFRSGAFYWKVIPIDAPYPVGDGLPGIQSDTQGVSWTDTSTKPSEVWADDAATTLKIAVDGSGIMSGTTETPNAGTGCVLQLCEGSPTTPVLSWAPVAGAHSYMVYVAQDINFTTTELPKIPVTRNTMLALRLPSGDSASTLPDSQAGSAYYWYVRPCTGSNGFDNVHPCGDTPTNRETPFTGTSSFSKASPAVGGLTSSNPNASEITFSWDDYYFTNQATVWNGQSSSQTAKNYRIQIDNEPSFSTPIDTKVVDQATYTAFDKLYADGTYFWRVQALDEMDNGLTWSAPLSFTKSSPPVTPSSPVGGAQVPGTTPFRWSAEAFAASYTVEVYRNNDLSFSTANRVFTATVKTTAYAPDSPIPAAGTPYVWRVRRQDASNNPGPWSNPQTFLSTGVAPSLLTPKAGIWLKNAGALFEWTEVPGAASYRLNIGGTKATSVTTVATAYAPSAQATGKYTWNVTAYDGAGNPLATSATRQYKVDATAPFIKKFKPDLGELKAKSTIKATFSEKVRGISGKSIKMYKAKGEKWVKIKVKIKALKKGKVASIDPKGRLKSGDYQIRFSTKLIKDVHGNSLVPSDVGSQTSARVRADLRIGR